MIELAWVGLLAFAYSHKPVRLLVCLLVAKWAASYTGFLVVGEFAPAITDLCVGLVFVAIVPPCRRARVIGLLFVATMLVHAAYWGPWELGVWLPLPYYYALLICYTAMVVALGPWETLGVRSIVDRLGRRGLAADRDVAQPMGSVASNRAASRPLTR